MRVIEVVHAAGRYDVIVAPGAVATLPARVEALLGPRRLAVVTDTTVAPLLRGWLGGHDWPGTVLTLPPGEAHKTRESWARLTDELLALGFGRDSALVAVGGGVVGDVAGFVAATFARGIPVVQVPTTLLAMLDASVGGKTGVDTPHGKNLVGAFHQPALVVADPRTLTSLDAREYRAGLAEAVKHGVIADAACLAWIESHADALLRRDEDALVTLVARSVEIKAEVVTADEREGGRRAVLNAGHTVAHALEHATGYALLHGEAVALGLVAEAAIAERLGVAQAGTAARVRAALQRLGLPTAVPQPVDAAAVIAATRLDKKNRAATVRCALPRAVGHMEEAAGAWTVPVDDAALAAGLGAIGVGAA